MAPTRMLFCWRAARSSWGTDTLWTSSRPGPRGMLAGGLSREMPEGGHEGGSKPESRIISCAALCLSWRVLALLAPIGLRGLHRTAEVVGEGC